MPTQGTTPLGLRLVRAVVLALAFSAYSAAHAQSPDCSLKRNPHLNALVPVMDGAFADPPLAAKIRQAYTLNFQLHESKQADLQFHEILDSALLKNNPCAEGLSTFALGVIAVNNHLSDAKPWFNQAETAFRAASASLAMARVHYELAYLANLNGQTQQAAQQYRAAATEL